MANQSTEQFVEIRDIKDNVVILKNGSLRAVVEVSAINFELRSEDEQIGILQNFQRFLNSVDFPLQVVMTSRKLNIEDYVKLVNEAVDATENELVKIQGLEYAKFISEISELANIMQKRFFIVVPFYMVDAPSPTGIFDSIKDLMGPTKKQPSAIDDEKFETAKNQLLQRVELIYDGLIGLGLKTKTLEHEELMTLFYSIYNHDNQTTFKKNDF